MSSLLNLLGAHEHDLPGKELFTAYVAAVPVFRYRASLVISEATELDPIEHFLLQGIALGLRSVRGLSGFFGLEETDVENSLGDMLHREWIIAYPGVSIGSSDALDLNEAGREALLTNAAYAQQSRDVELWVDGLTGVTNIKPPRQRLLRAGEVRRSDAYVLQAIKPRPKRSSDVDFEGIRRDVSILGSQLWAGTRVAVLLDILSVVSRGTGYKEVDVLVFQGDDNSVEFEVFDLGEEVPDYERALRSFEASNLLPLPVDIPPQARDMGAFASELMQVLTLAEGSEDSTQIGSEVIQAGPGRATVLKMENDDLRAELVDYRKFKELVSSDRILRNHENRRAWIDLLSGTAKDYVVLGCHG